MATTQLRCAECNKDAQVICHHCGKPLCMDAECCISIDDPAFGDLSQNENVKAHHCVECLKLEHPQNRKILPNIRLPQFRSTSPRTTTK